MENHDKIIKKLEEDSQGYEPYIKYIYSLKNIKYKNYTTYKPQSQSVNIQKKTPTSPTRKKKKPYKRNFLCCIKGCEKISSNRLLDSLKNKKLYEYKRKGCWICNYHYFADLYRFKKENNLL